MGIVENAAAGADAAVKKAAANKLAAIALVLSEDILSDDSGLSPSAIIALIATARAGEMPVGAIAKMVGLTHSAAVRLVDRLEKDWLLRRRRRVGREVLVEVTERGKRKARALAAARLQAGMAVVDTLDNSEAALLSQLLERMMTYYDSRDPGRAHTCRLCDRHVCNCNETDHVHG